MANTVTLTDQFIADTYDGVLHIQGEPFPETGQIDIYDGSGIKSSVKVGRACEGVTICGPLVIEGPLSATDITAGNEGLEQTELFNQFIKLIFPIGSLYLTTVNIKPFSSTDMDWEQVSQGRFLVGAGIGTDSRNQSRLFFNGDNSGEYNHQLTVAELPAHSHPLDNFQHRDDRCNDENKGYWDWRKSDIYPMQYTGSAGGDSPHNNTPPGYGIYIWKRTA